MSSKPKQKPKSGLKERKNVSFSEDTLTMLDEMAKAEDCNRSQLLTRLIREEWKHRQRTSENIVALDGSTVRKKA